MFVAVMLQDEFETNQMLQYSTVWSTIYAQYCIPNQIMHTYNLVESSFLKDAFFLIRGKMRKKEL